MTITNIQPFTQYERRIKIQKENFKRMYVCMYIYIIKKNVQYMHKAASNILNTVIRSFREHKLVNAHLLSGHHEMARDK